MKLQGRRILLGISGGIAAYKVPILVRQLTTLGAEVRVVMTEAAQAFVTKTTLQALSGHPVRDTCFDEAHEQAMGHIELARWADLLLVAPASAHILARLALGLADDLLSTLALATRAPLMIAPSMNPQMWDHPSVQAHVTALQARGITVLPTAHGPHACGEIGPGRMIEPEAIIEHILSQQGRKPYAGRRVLITAGPTQEPIDPARYISNASSGKMGYALAQVAQAQGAEVTLISGPCALPLPAGVKLVPVQTAQAMIGAVLSHIAGQDLFISAAAVADYRANEIATEKIKKQGNALKLTLVETQDILATVCALPQRPVCVGFAAESQDLVSNAKAKLLRKGCELICANDISVSGIGLGADDNALTLLTATDVYTIEKQSKVACAAQILDYIQQQLLK